MTTHVLTGLVKKRSDMGSEAKLLENQLREIQSDMATLDAAIKVLDPSFDLRALKTKTKKKPNGFFKHGESTRFVLDALRQSATPLSTIELGSMVVEQKGLNLDRADRKRLDACVLTAISRQRRKGVVVEAGRGDDGAIKWFLA